ncbi:hypothetical protein D3C76_1484500 [compost metagenome]
MEYIGDEMPVASAAFIHGTVPCPSQRRQRNRSAYGDDPETGCRKSLVQRDANNCHHQGSYSDHPGQPDVGPHEDHFKNMVM